MGEDQNQNLKNTPLEERLAQDEIRATEHELSGDLRKDPAFQDLLISYQKADWERCSHLMDDLLLRYPSTPRLLDFRTDIQTQLMLHQQSVVESKARDRQKFQAMLGWVAVLAAVLLIGAFIAYQAAKSYERTVYADQAQLEVSRQDRLASLETQADALLAAGKPQEALDVINQIQALDPAYAALPDLLARASRLINLTTLYENALMDIETGENEAALDKLNQIKAVDPFFRDVDYQIKLVNNRLEVIKKLAEAETAFREQRWLDVITSYELALDLDPAANSDVIKDHMVTSYLRSIVETLSKENETIEELERSEQYYRKAIALIPQDKEYIAERENLRQLSVELLITKYLQTGRSILSSPAHTVRQVEQAIGYLNKAVELGPDDATLTGELSKADLYLIGLKYFNAEKWEQAIQTLEELAKFNSSYPNGMSRQLLFEAYSARGERYFAGGFYMDARINYEAAEVIAWEDPANVLRLYQVQVDIARTLAKLDNFKDAVSYYKYVLDAINIKALAQKDTTFLESLQDAELLADQGNYMEAAQLYDEMMSGVEKFYTATEIEIRSGDNLAFIAGSNQSTIRAIRRLNLMTDTVTVSRGQFILIPTLP